YAVGQPAAAPATPPTATDASPREAQAAPQPQARPAPTLAAAAPAANPGLRPARTLENVAPSGALARYTQVSRYGYLYFVSGQIALDRESGGFDANADVAAQTLAALENV